MYLLLNIAAYHCTNQILMYDIASDVSLHAGVRPQARVTAGISYKGHRIPIFLL
jgi:hypothetical protein